MDMQKKIYFNMYLKIYFNMWKFWKVNINTLGVNTSNSWALK